MDNLTPNPDLIAKRTRQKRTLAAIATVLIAGGLVVLFALKRMPLPMRILVGLTDVFAGIVLLIVIRQKFGK